jgi:hypothetical protein
LSSIRRTVARMPVAFATEKMQLRFFDGMTTESPTRILRKVAATPP